MFARNLHSAAPPRMSLHAAVGCPIEIKTRELHQRSPRGEKHRASSGINMNTVVLTMLRDGRRLPQTCLGMPPSSRDQMLIPLTEHVAYDFVPNHLNSELVSS
jgi:hypothetical protein